MAAKKRIAEVIDRLNDMKRMKTKTTFEAVAAAGVVIEDPPMDGRR